MSRFLKYILLSLLLSPCFAEAQNRADIIRLKIEQMDKSAVLVVAHRGHWRFASENSILAIENAIKIGVDIVEIDIQRTKDGHLVLMHDETLDRTTTGQGRVDEISLDSLKTLHLKNGINITTAETVPTLEEVLMKFRGQVLFNLDKADRYVDDVHRLLQKTKSTAYVVMKTDKPFVDAKVLFHAYLGQTFIMPIINLDDKNAANEVQSYQNYLRPKLMEFIYRKDSNVRSKQMKEDLEGRTMLWYNAMWSALAGGHDDDMAIIDSNGAYGYLIDTLGANIIQTDRPEYLLQYLRSRNLHD